MSDVKPIYRGTGWESVIGDEYRTAHVRPLGDLIEHHPSGKCICGPRLALVRARDGDLGWVYVHSSLDGRESRAGRTVGG